nr:hypothetical protein [Tanacetum cinerariifolium]
MDSENDNDKVNIPSFSSSEPEVSYSNDLDFFKDFEKELPAIIYNDALTSKLDFLTEPTLCPQHIDEFNLKDETLSECDKEEQNILYFNNLFSFNVIYLDDLKSDKDNDDDKIDIKQPSRDMSVILLTNVINTDAPRAWYDILSSFLLSQEFSNGAVNPTLFTKKAGRDILLVQTYVDGIIFASTDPAMCDEFVKIVTSKFKMLMMGKLSFFLGLQIFQSPKGIFINQSNYALEIIKKYGMQSSDLIDTHMVEKGKLDEDLQGKPVDPTHYRDMIGSLMYLAFSKPDLVFVVCMCAQYQEKLSKKHLHATMSGVKIPNEAHLEVHSSWEINWSAGHPRSIRASSTEADYIALSGCCAQIL